MTHKMQPEAWGSGMGEREAPIMSVTATFFLSPSLVVRGNVCKFVDMENYIVSARKYRPATFDSVVGQKALTATLKTPSPPTGLPTATCSAVRAVWGKPRVPEFLPRPSTAAIPRLRARHATSVTAAALSTTAIP